MVSYQLAPEQQDLRDSVAQFARDVVAPVIGGYYERGEFPYDVVARMGKLGLFGLPFPEEYGGMGGDYFALCLALEELARVDSSVAITLEAGVSLGAMPIYRFGTEEQRRRWLPELCAGERLAAFGLTEPGGGSDIPGGMRTTARLEGQPLGGGRQQGLHHQRRHLDHLPGDGARHHRPRRGWPQGDLFDHHSERNGRFRAGPGILQGRLVRLRHQGAVLRPAAGSRRRTCSASAAGATPSSCRSWTRAGWRSPRWPPAWPKAAWTSASRYARQREAFGRRLDQHQAIQFAIADMEARAHTARLAWYDAAARLVAGQPIKKESAIAKLTASNAAMDNARAATQVFGGYGFMNEFPVARFYRDAKVLEIGEGTSEVQRMLIARELGLG